MIQQRIIGEEEALQILQGANVRVVMRPMAIMPAEDFDFSPHPIAWKEIDVIEAANMILLRGEILRNHERFGDKT